MMYNLNLCASLLVMMVVTTMVFDGYSAYTLVGSGDVFMRASKPTSATWYHVQALRFQNVEEDEFESYVPDLGGLFLAM